MAKSDSSTDDGAAVSDASGPVSAEGAVIANDPVTDEALVQGSAKDLFAALMAKASDEVKLIARELGTLLGLHTKASAQADTTGDYSAGDINK